MSETTSGTTTGGDALDRARAVAVVGIGCRFPGGVTGPADFWRLLVDGVDAITEIPESRFDLARFYDERPATPGHTMTRWGGFLDGLEMLDAGFFWMSPREAENLDPVQRLLLEVAWEALEDAGQDLRRVDADRAGVFFGQWASDFEGRLFADPDSVDFMMTTGSGRYASSGRVSYALGFNGPSLTIDSACSSGLAAVHLAVRSIRSGESTIALAGGANAILLPQITIAYSQSRMMAPDGHCKFGDASGDGYVRSEGAAVVALKSLAQAEADGDRVYGIIRGSALNNDGNLSGSMGTPSRDGQEALLRAAYRDACRAPGTVGYVEAHGTGTRAGDPVELGALTTVLGESRPAGQRTLVGSVKTNIGHTEAAAGVAGLVKVVLSLHGGTIPPSLHCRELNPDVPWTEPLELARTASEWPASDGPRLAGVSAFGIAGTNAHVVVEEAPPVPPPAAPAAADRALHAEHHVLALSARSAAALRQLAGRYAALIDGPEVPGPDDDVDHGVADVCRAAATRRTALDQRAAFVAPDRGGLLAALRATADGAPPTVEGIVDDDATLRTVFVCPGQGGQWVGMAGDLIRTSPVFAAALRRCDAAAAPYLQTLHGHGLFDLLTSTDGTGDEALERIDIIQPALVALAIAYAELFRSVGVVPDAVVGHSMGEVAAAHIAGALDLDQAMRIVCRRSALMRRTSGAGAMALVDLPMAEAAARLQGRESQISVAVSNSPRSCVVSGEVAAVDGFLAELEREEVFCRRVNVDVASHSPQMDAAAADLRAELDGLQPFEPVVPLYSTVLARPAGAEDLGAAYWARNLREPVLFGDTIGRLIDDGHSAFVELGPHPVLPPSIQQCAEARQRNVAAFGSGRRHERDDATWLEALARLWAVGAAVDWERVVGAGAHVPLPAYPWQRERYWSEAAQRQPGSGDPLAGSRGRHPLLQHRFRPAAQRATYFETVLHPDRDRYLLDHRIGGSAVLPAAAYCEAALAAAADVTPQVEWTLVDVELHSALALSETTPTRMQVRVDLLDDAAGHFEIRAREDRDGDGDGDLLDDAVEQWTLHATGALAGSPPAAPADPVPVDPVPADPLPGGGDPGGDVVEGALDADAAYDVLTTSGLRYGPAFRSLRTLWSDGCSATGAVCAAPDDADARANDYRAYPPVLDGALQALLVALLRSRGESGTTLVPVSIGRLAVHGPLRMGAELTAVVTLDGEHADRGGVRLLDAAGGELASATDVRFAAAPKAGGGAGELLYGLRWDAGGDRSDGSSGPDTAPGNPVLVLTATAETAAPLVEALRAAHVAHEVLVGAAIEPGTLASALQGLRATATGGRVDVVHMLALDAPPPTADPEWIERGWQLGSDSLVALAGTLTGALTGDGPAPDADDHAGDEGGGLVAQPRLWLVTRGATGAGGEVSVGQSPLWGTGRVLANEHPGLDTTLVDLDRADPSDPAAVGEELVDLLRSPPAERQLARREGAWLALRLAPFEASDASEVSDDVPSDGAGGAGGARNWRAHQRTPGDLGGLCWRRAQRPAPGPGTVEVEVEAFGLNFMNVMSALDIYPGVESGRGPLGIECAGRVARIGDGVTAVAVGDRVVAIGHDLAARYALVPEELVAVRPEGFTAGDLAGCPIAFATAWHALVELARLAPGERVLVHSAAGGVGLAARQVARLVGAEVIATAGTDDKRAMLRAIGVAHVFDSRHDGFADDVLQVTGGTGVDVVLNSLTGSSIEASLRTLAPFGRFVELGKRDIYGGSVLDLRHFRKNLAYFSVDLDALMRQRPDVAGRLLATVVDHLGAGHLEPLPVRSFPAGSLVAAYAELMPGTHVGKHVVELDECPPEALVAGPGEHSAVRGDGQYLITGGLGAIGTALARWLAERGAAKVVLVGRRGPDPEVRAVLDELAALGTAVVTERCDVAHAGDVERLVERLRADGPPLRGVIHAAGVLDDGVLTDLDPSRMRTVRDPKALGAWHLDRSTAGDELDFTLYLSSVASLFGTPGQGNYAAANAFLDALAHDRRRRGLPTLSVNLGPVRGSGLAAAVAVRGDSLERLGFDGIDLERAIEGIDLLLAAGVGQAACMRLRPARWHEVMGRPGAIGVLGDPDDGVAAGDAEQAQPDLAARLDAAPAGRPRRALLETVLREEVAAVLKMAPAQVPTDRSLKALGLDSLMALELRGRLERQSGLALSPTLAWNHPTINALGEHLAGRLGVDLDAPSGSSEPSVDAGTDHAGTGDAATDVGPEDADLDAILAELGELDDDEARRLLAGEDGG